MNKKKILLLSTSAILMLGAIGSTAYALEGNIPLSLFALDHEATHHMSEHAFIAPTTSTDGYTNYWRCDDCCKVSANSARYDFYDKNKLLTEEEVTLPKLTAATQEDIDASLVNTINNAKFKNLDQSSALFVKDEGKTAVFASKSNVTGEPVNAKDNTGASEFRFTVPEANRTTGSVTFSYKYLDYGKGVWQGGDYTHQIENGHVMVQFKDNGAYIPLNLDGKLTNDNKWHTIKISYSDFLGGAASTTSFTDFIFKIVDFRGCLMIADINYESAVSVTLKNAKADGSNVTETISKGTLPVTTPDTISGKTFLGWFDEAGNKVTEVTSNCTLIAHYGIEKADTNNEILMAMPADVSAYTKPSTVEHLWTPRGANIKTDQKEGRASLEEGCHVFHVLKEEGYEGTVGFTLPAFDFSTSGPVFFTFGFNGGLWANLDQWIALNGNQLGNDGADQATGVKFRNFTATIIGKNVNVYNYFTKTNIKFELDEETYKGQKGLEMTANKVSDGYFLSVNPFRTLNLDYFAGALKIENALPSTPVTGYEEQVKAYQEYRTYFSEVESTLYPISSKMKLWLDKVPKKILTFENNVTGLTPIGNKGQTSWDDDTTMTNIKKGNQKLWAPENSHFPYDEDYLLIRVSALSDPNQQDWMAFTLPTVNYSEYSKVEFSFGVGGNGGGTEYRFFFGIPEANSDTWSTNANFIGSAKNYDGWKYTQDVKATIQNGKITFASASSSFTAKEFTLDADINTGTKGLSLAFGNVAWDAFVMSPLQAIKPLYK